MEEQKEDGRYFHVENIAKNIVTTVIGALLMLVSSGTVMVSWFIVLPMKPEYWQLAVIFGLGFALLFMRDKLTTYIDVFTRKKIDNG